MAKIDKEKERYYQIYRDSKGKLRDAWGRFLSQWKDIDTYDPTKEVLQVNRQVRITEFKKLTYSNVCEIVYVRRRPERAPAPPRPMIRRMICAIAGINTYNPILVDQKGMDVLGFRYPNGRGKKIDENEHNIVVVWDIIMQDYRNVSMEECYLRQIIPNDAFWQYFRDTLSNLSSDQKRNFIDSY